MTGAFPRRERDQRGVVFSSSVVMLSIVAVVMAGVAFLATHGDAPTEKKVATPVSAPEHTAPAKPPAATKPAKPKKPAVRRGKVYVEVYNNSNVTGLAGRVGTRATTAGWKVVGTDNWYGTVPTTTVYFPPRLKAAAKQLALDLGIERTAPAVDPMRGDRLTLILTEPLD